MSTFDSKLIRPQLSLQPDYLAFNDLHDSLRQNKGYNILKCQNNVNNCQILGPCIFK